MRNLDVLGPGLVSPGGSQLLLDLATTPSGTTCANFVCSGRAAAKATCTPRDVPMHVAERWSKTLRSALED